MSFTHTHGRTITNIPGGKTFFCPTPLTYIYFFPFLSFLSRHVYICIFLKLHQVNPIHQLTPSFRTWSKPSIKASSSDLFQKNFKSSLLERLYMALRSGSKKKKTRFYCLELELILWVSHPLVIDLMPIYSMFYM